jgi:hypothetical protein
MSQQIRISDSVRLLKIHSEPYVRYGSRGYTAAIDVTDVHTGEEGYLMISAMSLGETLRELEVSVGKLTDASITIQKENASRLARYIVKIAD